MNFLIEEMLAGKAIRSYKITQCYIFPGINDQAGGINKQLSDTLYKMLLLRINSPLVLRFKLH